MRGAELRGAEMRGAEMRGAEMRGAEMRGAEMGCPKCNGGPEGPPRDGMCPVPQAVAVSSSTATRPAGAATLAITKFRAIVALVPSGSTTSSMWITSPITLPVRSTVM